MERRKEELRGGEKGGRKIGGKMGSRRKGEEENRIRMYNKGKKEVSR